MKDKTNAINNFKTTKSTTLPTTQAILTHTTAELLCTKLNQIASDHSSKKRQTANGAEPNKVCADDDDHGDDDNRNEAWQSGFTGAVWTI